MTAVPIRLCHIVNSLESGGMENGLVNLVNRMPAERYSHDIVCLTVAGRLAERIRAPGVAVHALGKASGRDLGVYLRLYRLLRRLGPDIVHTRNLPTADLPLLARAAGVRRVVHGEHGLDMHELAGARRYVHLRRLNRPFVDRYVALGNELRDWLVRAVGADPERVEVIYNGVDSDAFRPLDDASRRAARAELLGVSAPDDAVVLGTVGRLSPIKRQRDLVAAAALILARRPELRTRLRVAIVGDGPERAALRAAVDEAGLGETVRLGGHREDVPRMLGALDVFVLPSFREGVSNAILEAMATGVAVVATAVGANAELIAAGRTGLVVPPSDPTALAEACLGLIDDPARLRAFGEAGRLRACETFGLEAMVGGYDRLYRRVAGAARRAERAEVAA